MGISQRDAQFLPIILSFVENKGGADAKKLLEDALK